jgi:hypothetical protein
MSGRHVMIVEALGHREEPLRGSKKPIESITGNLKSLPDDWKITEADMIRILRIRSGEAFAADDIVKAHKYKRVIAILLGTDDQKQVAYRGADR